VGEQPIVQFVVSVGLGPRIVPGSGVLGVLDPSSRFLDCLDHDPAQSDRYDFVGIPMKVPNREEAEFFRPFGFSSSANRCDGGKLFGVLCGRSPSAETSLAQTAQVHFVRVDGIFEQELVDQTGDDVGLPP